MASTFNDGAMHKVWNCPLKSTNERKPHEKKFYENEYDDTHDPLEFFEVQKTQNAAMIHAKFFKGVDNVLDYGCGPGGKLYDLINTGVDI